MHIYNGKMMALHLLGKGKCEVRETDIPAPNGSEALIKVCASAICGSEKPYYYMEKDMDVLSGHETVGIVVDPGKSSLLKEGDRVALYAVYGCGECYYCKNGLTQFCHSFQGVSNSGHAQYTVCRAENCIKIPDDIPFDSAVLIYGDTLGVAYRAMKRTHVKKGAVAYVIGAGPVGLGIMAYLKYKGAYVVVGEPAEYRRGFAASIVGVDKTLNPSIEDVDGILKSITDGLGPESVFECSGNPAAQISALSAVRRFGAVCFAGENTSGLTIIPTDHISHKEINLTGAFYYAPGDVTGILEDYKNGLKADSLVSHKFPLEKAEEAFELFMTGKAGKVILHPWN